ncbi:MAG: hypothetical protein WKF43_05710 [Acidimicrobiales bacterium]
MTDGSDRQELRALLRPEFPPADAVVVVRGGPTSLVRLASHARRTHDAFVLDGGPVYGVSVFCALDDLGPASLEALLLRFASYRVVHLPTVGQLRAAGFELLASFNRPHFTVAVSSVDEPDLQDLVDALGAAQPNPYHGGARPRRR